MCTRVKFNLQFVLLAYLNKEIIIIPINGEKVEHLMSGNVRHFRKRKL